MALEDTFTPPLFYFEIPQGTHFHLEFPPFVDGTTGDPFDFTADPEGDWSGRMEIRDAGENLVCAFATSGEEGVITLSADGVLALDMNAAYTAALPVTVPAYDRPALVFADIELTDPSDDEPWRFFVGRGRITKEVTSG